MSIFNWKGIDFLYFTHLKVKFVFVPSLVVEKVKKSVKFYCSMYFKHGMWVMRTCSIPLSCKDKVFSLLFNPPMKDMPELLEFLEKTYHILVEWSKEEEKFRWRMYNVRVASVHFLKEIYSQFFILKRYLQDKEALLFTDDEELFLTTEEIRERREMIDAVFKRMVKPESTLQYERRPLRTARLHLL